MEVLENERGKQEGKKEYQLSQQREQYIHSRGQEACGVWGAVMGEDRGSGAKILSDHKCLLVMLRD